MALKSYGVLAGKAIAGAREDDESSPHYQVHVRAAGVDYRIAVNVKSAGGKPQVLYLAEDRFEHPLLAKLTAVAEGYSRIPSAPGGLALDFIRANLFDKSRMQPLPHNLPGPDNDLNDRVEHYVARAIREEGARVFAFGERWGPEAGVPDKIFHFRPGNGIHDIHMNQGNDANYQKDDGVWQDGGLLFHFPATGQWSAIFLAFQSQSWHTDDQTGHAIADGGDDRGVRIVAAMINPAGPEPETESVWLLNASPVAVDVSGWSLADQQKRKSPLSGVLPANGVRQMVLKAPAKLGNSGGLITLLDGQGLKVHGVSYTKDQARREGWLVVF